ncbi:Fe-S cluster assembly protein SufD [Pedomonas mirosovicensis]|uniref:Fe-S cluster assembly protein SufD n=1 Tax=Pedomonas mirosovicensis TaxID=2908641 RepID=UPI0021693E8E|nr:Fe-S cluster assembly protein SufD [Pedomonas mirosovicensis]MCH8683945.1 Fe-S cluster assembly protein SufD [Pedomonas mirosovicensis]
MSAPFTLPTKRDEAWRYSDLKALEAAMMLPDATDAPASEALSLQDGESLALPLEIREGRADVSRSIAVARGATATLEESFKGGGWLNPQTTIHVGEGAALSHHIGQMRDDAALTTAHYDVEVARNAIYRVHILNTGGHLGRVELDIRIHEGAKVDLSGVLLSAGSRTIELVTRFHHIAPDATSRQTVRSVAADKATVTYLGKIVISEGSQRIDAEQSSKALLLNRTATANAKPELEIYANDVKCAHGATIGELDKQALFYLATRGVDPAEAKALLTEAFVADAIEPIEDETLREAFSAAATDRLHAMVRGGASEGISEGAVA